MIKSIKCGLMFGDNSRPKATEEAIKENP